MERPWETEPYYAAFKLYGYKCEIKRIHTGYHLAGYVWLPKKHKLFGVGMLDQAMLNAPVHGGVSYTGPEFDPDSQRYWLVGFDCGRGGDYLPMFTLGGSQNYKDFTYVTEELRKLVLYLYEVDAGIRK